MTDPVWEIKSPGVLWLPPTGIEIERVIRDRIAIYQIKHNGEPFATKWAFHLETAKLETMEVIRELLEMGIEP